MAKAIRSADDAVRQALCVGGHGFAGSTAAMAFLENDHVWVAWVGDSRVYHLRGPRVVERTRDHKLVQDLVDSGQLTTDEAKRSALGSIITRALGGNPPGVRPVEPATIEQPWLVEAGDRVVLCSDGLSDLVGDDEIGAWLHGAEAQAAAERLVGLAVDRGGHDNITVIVAAAEGGPQVKIPRPPLNPALVFTLVLAAGFAAWLAVQAARAF
jgi:protein phosphatase